MVRVKSKWNVKDRERSFDEIASALGFNCWRIAQQALLNLENAGFQTDTNLQRLDVIKEFCAFMIHVVDRMAYQRITDEERAELVNALARKLADYVQDNTRDFAGPGDYRAPFVELLNRRMDDYAEFPFADDEPGFGMKRFFGDRVTEVMGEELSKWIGDQIIDIEAPEATKTLKRVLRSLLPELKEPPQGT